MAASSTERPAASPATTTASAPLPPSLRDRIPRLQPRRRPAPPENATPVPETPPMPPAPAATAADRDAHVFAVPRRRILTPHDHELFLASPTCTLLQAWVFGLADAVKQTPASVFSAALARGPTNAEAKAEAEAEADTEAKAPPQRPLAPIIFRLLAVLDAVEAALDACPPDETGGSRFGNKRFRAFVDLVRERAPGWHRDALGLANAGAVAEAAAYLGQAFGNRARIDYGSGHELHFAVWLLCLRQLGLLSLPRDGAALVLVVFARYLRLMRRVQTAYYLEPAGSHGVWGLDDYQFLPFLFGAAQLHGHRFITPRAVHQPLTLEQFGDDYLYLGQVRFVNSIKVATVRPGEDASAAGNSLRWHSPMLDDISAARSWDKIEAGMRRMFLAEVLRKLPVMQHFLFGSLVPAAPGMTEPAAAHPNNENGEQDPLADDDDDVTDSPVDVFDENGVRHIHTPTGWGDCCGIRVPSSFGAAGELGKRRGDVLRRIPFD